MNTITNRDKAIALGIAVMIANAYLKAQNDFKESEHPRDDDGKFTDGSGASGDKSSVIEIKGNELGEYKDIKELRHKAIEYYKNNLAGTKLYREGIGKIDFVNRGLKEYLYYSANEIKLKAIVYVKDIIKTGEAKYENLHKKRNDNIIGFWSITQKIKINSKEDEATVLIAKDKNGNLFYELFIDDYKRIHNEKYIQNNNYNYLKINISIN